MKICPYCSQLIEDNHPYCPNCNKPLISNLEKSVDKNVNLESSESDPFSFDVDEQDEIYEETIIKDDEIDRKIQEIDEVLERNEILGDPIPGSLLLEKSSLYYKKRDLPNALRNLELALRNFEEEDDLFNVAICHNEIGLMQEDTGYFDQAIYHFNRSLEILKEVNDNQKVIKVLNNLGNIYYSIKDLEHSYKFYQEALDISKQENLIYEEVKTSSNLVEVLYLLKDYDRIKRILARNFEFFEQEEDGYGIIATKIKYGKLYYYIGTDYDLASEELKMALQLIERVDNSLSVFIRAKLEWECYLYLGRINLMWNNLDFAENYFVKSLEAVRIFEIGENINEGQVIENLAELYNTKGETEKSNEYYNLSCEIYYKFGNNKKCAQIKIKISENYLNIDDKSTAIKILHEALDIYENLRYTKELADIHDKLGDIYISKRSSDIALEHYEKARVYYFELEDEDSLRIIEGKIKSLQND
ncbi:MAG: tetratricopeptide repeat protein [Candidatus Lokiarchaeota archaeon]|nr:tetratricopeptide repeat protein [Candidatus Lokiarchaeota archaeon]